MKSITLLSPAKINLILEVLGKRPDGYHEIRSIMQPVNLFDEVRIELREGKGIEVECRGLKVPRGKDNIAWRAADLFLQETGLSQRVDIFIHKRIPLGAGLGGGSGNGAAVLVGLNRLTRKLGERHLLNLASKIGADVAFFIFCQTAAAEGKGEKITLIRNFPLFHYVLVNPGFEVSTKKIYDLWDEAGGGISTPEGMEDTISSFRARRFPLRNDLDRVTTRIYPRVKDLKDTLTSMGAEAVSMAGTGPTVFAVFNDRKKAKLIYDYLKDGDQFKSFLVEGISGWHKL